jgi:UDP-N-acetylmuramoyl-L-alanyl-D-glutamate--2,6-diaminopimelate ligase
MMAQPQMHAQRVDAVANEADVLRAIEALPVQIEHVTASSRDARRGALFLAYPGAARDGRSYIEDAIARGVSAIAYEADDFEWNAAWKVPHFAVKGLKNFASAIGGHVYADPSSTLWMVGVTGTNGKTSVSQWVAEALQLAGRRTAVLGTIGNGLVGALSPSDNTTPDALVLQRALRNYVDEGAVACAMEVSSHGLDQGRVSAVKYDVAVFTNLTRDHLDYHGTMEAYGEAKAQLFALRGLKAAVINVDDPFGRQLATRVSTRSETTGQPLRVVRFAINGGAILGNANLVARHVSVSSAGLSFYVEGRHDLAGSALVETEILGAFNASNLLAVIGALVASGQSISRAAEIVAELRPVPGRMQTVRASAGSGGSRAGSKPLVVVDYAHSPDALEKALGTVAAIVPGEGRLIVVFGCGGDRDRGKRPLMGAIAARHADLVVVTSDNPRTESPEVIIADIVAGMPADNGRVRIVADRHQAIFEALNLARHDDVVLIAGKGHEDYQILGHEKHHFSDTEVASDALSVWTDKGSMRGGA